ncbi:MAG: Dam family site-specific DNA-(adenine-N6)-methyltransferase [Puniceicoccales bacterium]|nr:Dam family site-specific DNA-(adenine-N6)-methyltransferase [Puniceicoccales bacterium]
MNNLTFQFFAGTAAKPFVKWVGGKGQLREVINEALPAEFRSQRELTYVEPFVGGGAVLFEMLKRYPNITKVVINDINDALIRTYKTVRDHLEPLIAKLQTLQNSYDALADHEQRKSFFLHQRETYNSFANDDIAHSALFIFLNKTCFNGLHRVNSKGKFNVPFGGYPNPNICDVQTLRGDSELLRRVEILTGDFEQTLDYAGAAAFYYLDPPYKPISQTASFNSYAKETFDDTAQIRLKDFCDALTRKESRWIMSNSDVRDNGAGDAFFDKLYSAYNIKRVFASRAVNSNGNKRGKISELLITNIAS